jgi:glycosyltransferase involved in cell wall biosynthesis
MLDTTGSRTNAGTLTDRNATFASMISCIVPAHNEQALLGQTLSVLQQSMQSLGEPYEIIVVNDASTDRTAQIALEHGTHVLSVHHRQIAATRNAGANAAMGHLLIFVDADTSVTQAAVRAAVAAMREGAVGGGACVRFDSGPLPLYARILEILLPPTLRLLRLAPGCFLFCTRQAYLAAGGFDEAFFVAEEVVFANRLKRQGRFVILPEFVITSARKLRPRSALALLWIGVRLALGGTKALRRREGLEYWYAPREPDRLSPPVQGKPPLPL